MTKSPFEPMTLENVGDGRAAELFTEALRAMAFDLEDAEKDHEARRRFTLHVDFVPSKSDDGTLEVVVGADVKLAKPIPHRTFARRAGGPEKFLQYRNIQEELPLENVHPLNQEEAVNDEQ